MSRRLALIAFLLFASPAAYAQSFEVSGNFVLSQWSEFDGDDFGFGGRLTFKPMPLIGIDADLAWYPGEFPPDAIPFSDNRFEGLFGVTVGPRINRIRPFAKVAAGFLNSNGAQERIACIAIFPPPLHCALAADQTLSSFEFGGGIEIDANAKTFVRMDVTDRMLKYPGPTLDRDFRVSEDGFYGHALRFTIGAGFRF
jgi:hypothetical protein